MGKVICERTRSAEDKAHSDKQQPQGTTIAVVLLFSFLVCDLPIDSPGFGSNSMCFPYLVMSNRVNSRSKKWASLLVHMLSSFNPGLQVSVWKAENSHLLTFILITFILLCFWTPLLFFSVHTQSRVCSLCTLVAWGFMS